MEGSPRYHRVLEHALTGLLARVVTRKRSSPLDPPVPLDFVAPHFHEFKGHPVQHIEQAARSCVYRIANSIGEHSPSHGVDKGQRNGSAPFDMMYAYDFLDILLILSENSLAADTLVHHAMEEFVDCTVIEIGKLIFEYMQSRSARLVQGFHPQRGKGPILLRTTNELKRRLSRETDAAFIGRIMIFISLLLPPWERSGVNLRGNYNVENITKYEDEDEQMAVDGEEDTQDSFYVKFWSLQKYLKNPLILHNQAMLDEFKPKLDYVLNKFAVIEQERMRLRQTAARSSNAAVDQKMDIVIGSEEKSEYYPGFLKSRQLFDLQMADSKFRRTVLFQVMVLMRHLLSLTTTAKSARDTRTTTPNKVVLYPFTLSDADAAWATQKDKDAFNLTDLAFQPHPQFRTFSKAVRAVLDRDEAWVRWKENGCQPFEEVAWTEREFEACENRLRTILAPVAPVRYVMGNPALSDLWSRAGELTLESLRGRLEYPSPERFLGEPLDKEELEGMTPGERIEKIDEVASGEWRGLRLAMRLDMAKVLDNGGSLRKFVEATGGTVEGSGKEAKVKISVVDEKGEPMDVDTKAS